MDQGSQNCSYHGIYPIEHNTNVLFFTSLLAYIAPLSYSNY